MDNDKPSKGTVCPMCHQIPEDFGLKDHNPFVWNAALGCYICEFCDLELAIEFYQENTKYFDIASNMSGIDVWELKKRYLDHVLNITLGNLPNASNNERELLSERVTLCRIQIHAINRFLEIRKSGNTIEIEKEYANLQKAFCVPAFDIDVVLQNLISIEIP